MASAEVDAPVWLITGCSSGFGREIAQQVLARGWRALVTARNPDVVSDIVEAAGDRARAFALDVSRPDQIRAAVAAAEEAFGRIDVLVNNAGFSYLTSIEEGDEQRVRALFETNFFGALALTKAVLPRMRERRSGHIIYFSSIGGLAAFPGSGYYAATKFALEGLAEALAPEVEPLGVKVTLIEPGPFRTGMAARAEHAPSTIADYDQTVGVRRRQFRSTGGDFPGDPIRGAAAVIDVTTMDKPPLRLVLGKPALEVARRRFLGVLDEFARWETVTLASDYPEFQEGNWGAVVEGGA